MRRGMLLLLGFLFAGCAPLMLPFQPTFLSPTPIPSAPPSTPTDTNTPTSTATLTPTESITSTVTLTKVSFRYVFPLQPPGAAGFADGTASHGYPATDIFAVVGTKFVAVTDGVVDFVSYQDLWDPVSDDPAQRGGLSVAVIGEDGLRYYGSHLSAIADGIVPGASVKAGQLLGLVGNSGDARKTLSHLHFGISRPTYPEDWEARRGQVDPYPFLLAWMEGQNVTPPLPSP